LVIDGYAPCRELQLFAWRDGCWQPGGSSQPEPVMIYEVGEPLAFGPVARDIVILAADYELVPREACTGSSMAAMFLTEDCRRSQIRMAFLSKISWTASSLSPSK
jgi:hypothetical protein